MPRNGEVLGLVGSNGTGKSTALKILSGKMKPNLGKFIRAPRLERRFWCTSVGLNCRTTSRRSWKTICGQRLSRSTWITSPRQSGASCGTCCAPRTRKASWTSWSMHWTWARSWTKKSQCFPVGNCRGSLSVWWRSRGTTSTCSTSPVVIWTCSKE